MDEPTLSPMPTPSDRSPVFLVVAVIALIIGGVVIYLFLDKRNEQRNSNLPVIESADIQATPTEVPNTYPSIN